MQPMTKPDSETLAALAPEFVLPVNEVFETIQGEASFTGSPALFIRLQGCEVGCSFCDTRHTWDLNKALERPLKPIVYEKKRDAPTYALASLPSLLAVVSSFRARHIVITGGEPALYDLRDLSKRLIEMGRSVQLETSGTEPVLIDERAFVTLSPKIGMAGGKVVRDDAWERADEIKMPVGKMADVDKLIALLERAPGGRRGRTIWLQPLSVSPKATQICIEAATVHGWRLSIQTHKFIGVR